MTVALHPRAHVRALGLALVLSSPIAGLVGCSGDNPPSGSISAPRSAPKESGKPEVSAKKGGDAKAGLGAKERLGLEK
jgi:hypothetical protein